MFLDAIAGLAKPWADLYSGSPAVETTVMFLHLGALVVAGGLALAADRSAWKALRRPESERALVLADFSGTHRPVVIGLAIVLLAGVALALADVATFGPSPLFWVKMGFVALLLANGYWLQRTERRLQANVGDERAWRALRAGAVRSSALWITVILLGVTLTNAG